MNTIRNIKEESRKWACAFAYLPCRCIDAGFDMETFPCLKFTSALPSKFVETVQVHLVYRTFRDMFIYKSNELYCLCAVLQRFITATCFGIWHQMGVHQLNTWWNMIGYTVVVMWCSILQLDSKYLLNYLLTHLLTHSLTHSLHGADSFWKANWFCS